MTKWYYCLLCDRYHKMDSKIGKKHKKYGLIIYSTGSVGVAERVEDNPKMTKRELLSLLSPSELKELMHKLKAKSVEDLLHKLPSTLDVYPYYYTNPKETEARICIRVGKHKVCFPPFKMKTGIWPKGLFAHGTIKEIVAEAVKRIKSGVPYATVVREINLVRVWNKRNKEMWEKLSKVLEILKRMHKRGEI